MAKLTDIPKELLIHIFEETDLKALLRACQACKKLEELARDVLLRSETAKTLYVHPSPKALERVLLICANTEFAKRVETVHFLGEIHKPDWVHSRTQYSWPQLFSTSPLSPQWNGRGNPAHFRFANPQNPTFLEGYQPLFAALAKLPNLSAIRHSTSAAGPGLNKVSDHRISRWVQDLEYLTTSEKAVLWTDAEPFLFLLGHTAPPTVTSLQWDEALCNPLHRPTTNLPQGAFTHVINYAPNYSFNPVFGLNVTRLSLQLSGETWWTTTDEHSTALRMIHAFPALQELIVALRGAHPGDLRAAHQNQINTTGHGLNINAFLSELSISLPLRCLELTSTDTRPPTIHFTTWNNFITDFRNTLKRLVLRDVIFIHVSAFAPGERARNIEAATHNCLQDARTRLSLDSARVFVRRRHCSPSCLTGPGQGAAHRSECDLYMGDAPHQLGWAVTAHVYERVAGSLGVVEKDGGWDFGDYVLGR